MRDITNHFAGALIVSTVMALIMMGAAYGIMYLFSQGSPLPSYLILLIIAISFIVGSTYFDRRGADQMYSMIGGGVVSLAAAFLIISVVGGIRYIMENGGPGAEQGVSGLAVCMIFSMILIKTLTAWTQTA